MLNTKQDNKQWRLIRTDNGEWISDEYAVFISEQEATVLRILAAKQGKPMAIQHGPEGCMWCYKHELEAIDVTHIEANHRTLRVSKHH